VQNYTKSNIILQRRCITSESHRGVPALFRKVDINRSAVDVSICLLLSEWQICISWSLTIVLSTPRLSTTKTQIWLLRYCVRPCLPLKYLRSTVYVWNSYCKYFDHFEVLIKDLFHNGGQFELNILLFQCEWALLASLRWAQFKRIFVLKWEQ